MTTLYYVANRLNYLVAGTGNRTEIAIGYYTKYGDGGVDLLPLGALVKSEVRALARELGVPERVIEKPPSAGLWIGQTDEGEMGFTYAELEDHLLKGPDAVAPATAMKIERLVRASEHKRHMPPMFEPRGGSQPSLPRRSRTEVSFGRGERRRRAESRLSRRSRPAGRLREGGSPGSYRTPPAELLGDPEVLPHLHEVF